MCLDRGTLQAYLDRELESQATWELESHLSSCPGCSAVLADLKRSQVLAEQALAGYRQETARLEFNTSRAWARFHERVAADSASSNQGGISPMLKRYRSLLAAVAAVLLLVGVLGYGPTRTLAASFLTIFRAEKVQVITFNPNDFKDFEQTLRQAGVADIKDFGKIEVTGKQEQKTVSASEAATVAGFATKLPASLTGGLELKKVSVNTRSTVSITPDVKNLNTILAAMGGRQMLPDNLSGKTFTLKTPSIVNASYTSQAGNVNLVQAPSPEIIAPEGVDVEAIRTALLGIPSLPSQFRQQLSLKDWQRTVLIPNVNGRTQEVSVNGTSGAFIATPNEQRGVLIWQQSGIWYGLEGNLTLKQAQNLAAALK